MQDSDVGNRVSALESRIEEFNNTLKKILVDIAAVQAVIGDTGNVTTSSGGPSTDSSALHIPVSLVRSYMSLTTGKYQRVTASDLALTTGRSRSLESHYLQRLAILGLARAARTGRRMLYTAA